MSSSSSASPSSSSAGSDCPDKCHWELDQFGQWQNTCFGCDPYSFCREPGSSIPPGKRGEPTDCEPYGNPFPSSSSGGVALARQAMSIEQGMIRVPSVSDPKVWQTLAVNLSVPWRYVQLPTLGWIVVIMRMPSGPGSPLISPLHAPADVIEPADKALCASVILPEGGGHSQYWVPVVEQYRWATLDTPNWRVLFLRLPLAT